MYESLRRVALRPDEPPYGAEAVPRPLSVGGVRRPSSSSGGGGAGLGVSPGSPAAAVFPQQQQQQQRQNHHQQHVSTHSFAADPRNNDVLVGIRDGSLPSHAPPSRSRRPPPESSAALLAATSPPPFDLVWRPLAKVSVLDSAFLLGDGLWEGLRVRDGVVLFAKQHLDRLWEGLRALDFRVGLTKPQLLAMVHATLDANCGMGLGKGGKDVHVRLMVSRGLKSTPYQDPEVTIGLPLIVCLPEWKRPQPRSYRRGLKLATVPVRRGAPDVQDPHYNSHSKINCIAAKIAANKVEADEALMLDPQGFVATCNSTNFFLVVSSAALSGVGGGGGDEGGEGGGGGSGGSSANTRWRGRELLAPRGVYQRRGVTRENVLRLARALGLPCREADFGLSVVYSAEEAFVTGTFGGLVPVRSVDGRAIGDWRREEQATLSEEEERGAGEEQEEEEDQDAATPLAALLSPGGAAGPVTRALAAAYEELCAREAAAGRGAAMAAVSAGRGVGGVGGGAK
jgi:branched-chain amino acid aminotransferase